MKTYTERQLDSLHRRGVQVALLLHGVARSLEIYDVQDSVAAGLIAKLFKASQRFSAEVGEPLSLKRRGDELVVNDRLLRLDEGHYRRCRNLAALMGAVGVDEVTFGEGLVRGDLDALAADLATSLQRHETVLQDGGYGALQIVASDDRRATGDSRGIERRGIWFSAALLESIERAAVQRRAGGQVALLPIKRLLQRVIDSWVEAPGTWQLLMAVRLHGEPPAPAQRRLFELLHALGLGVAIQLSRADLLALALALILSPLDGEAPGQPLSETLVALLHLPSLGELAPRILLALRDAEASRQGEARGLPWQLIHLVKVHERYLATASPDQALRTLEVDRPPGLSAELVASFVDWKGAFPLGALLRLSDSRLAVVVGADRGTGPLLAVLDADGVFERLDRFGGHPAELSFADPHAMRFALGEVRKKWRGQERRQGGPAQAVFSWTGADVLPDPTLSDYDAPDLPDWVMAVDGDDSLETSLDSVTDLAAQDLAVPQG